MKISCNRIVLLLCSLMLLIVNQTISAKTVVGPPFKFTFTETLIPEGEVGCVDVVVEGFEDVSSMEFGMTFDTDLFRFDEVITSTLDPSSVSASAQSNVMGTEILTVIFFDIFPATLPDGSIAFSLCFESLGTDGEFSTLTFSDLLANGNPSQIFANGTSYMAPELCVVGADITIGDIPQNISIIPTVTPSTCQSSQDGSITLDITGGVLPYSLFVTDCTTGAIVLGPEPAGNSVIINTLDPGDYCIAVTDDSMPSLLGSSMVTVINGGPSLGAAFNTVEPACNGLENGSIEVFAVLNTVQQSNPNGDFSFIWTGSGINGQVVGANLINVGAGSYDVLITEVASGCAVEQNIFLTQPAAIVVDIVATNENCDTGGMDGTAAAVTTGGVGEYTFMWDDLTSSTDSIVTGLGQGTYNVVVRDANNCPGMDSEIITAPLRPQILGFDSTRISCPGQMDGRLEVLFIDGSATVDRVEWILPGGATQTGTEITNIGPGDYTVTVIAVDNCFSTMMVTLGDAEGVQVDLVNSSTIAPECGDPTQGMLGSLSIVVLGGVSPYIVTVNGIEQQEGSQNITGLQSGTYDVFVTDASGCSSTTVQMSIAITPPLTVTFSPNIIGTRCFEQGPFTGSATAIVTGGTGPAINYTWASGEDQATASALMGGVQSLLVSSGDCSVDTTVTIPEPSEIIVESITANVSCFGETDGQIELNSSGGTGMITFETTENLNGNTISDLPAGQYNIIALDENNCAEPFNLFITQPDSLDAFISDVQDITCNGESDGLLISEFTGGTGIVSYQWDSSSIDTFSTNTTLSAGDYVLTVEDSNGCIDTAIATIVEPVAIFPVVLEPELAPCFGEQTNISVAQASGGNGGPYTYSVNAGPVVPVGSEIPVFAGDYTITVFDGRGCRETIEITANEPPELQVFAGADQEINLGASTFIFGSIQSSVGIDSIFWLESPGDSTLNCYDCTNPTASPLDDSFYELFARDLNGCLGSDEVFIKVDSDRNVYIPNIFSPNVDGFNDFFSPFTGLGVSQILSFTIYDRWGELMFEKEDFLSGSSEASGWDGKHRGKPANQGVYFYIASVEFIDGVVLTYRGNVTLVNNKEN